MNRWCCSKSCLLFAIVALASNVLSSNGLRFDRLLSSGSLRCAPDSARRLPRTILKQNPSILSVSCRRNNDFAFCVGVSCRRYAIFPSEKCVSCRQYVDPEKCPSVSCRQYATFPVPEGVSCARYARQEDRPIVSCTRYTDKIPIAYTICSDIFQD